MLRGRAKAVQQSLPNHGTDAHVIQVNAATPFHTHPPMGHMQATFTRLEDILLPVFRPADQLDCRRSPACAWKPEDNQCGFASASSALE
ncbi:hypothetical protein O181_123945 [Austropuccinia psidii MF-1]|uniref:Uncharacterized protein n=1 Tax=Austropuccinia psidii MF-1 TaxID=1389203 RepID=A0A9Q3KS57_9BASI|nr:hypothetical protein [Austropuccinia psidii MF-1]